ncbi:MAG: divalent-cation tolerance protein CutA [Desulfobacteraceae bacterium]|nr:divalent-cation tolerance protein CutA [Desulfobacteraceae bacterium]
MKYCMVIVTCANESDAKQLASDMVEKKLAACVQLNPITSIYTWQKKVTTDQEIRLVIKTKSQHYKNLEKLILARHEYEVPQIIQIPFEKGLETYLDWIDETT